MARALFLDNALSQFYQANLIAGKLGIAPEVYYFIRPEGYLVTRFINGRPILPEEICQSQNLRRVTQLIRKIQGAEKNPVLFVSVIKEFAHAGADKAANTPVEKPAM